MNYNAIKLWLESNGDNSYFELQDDGEGVYIKVWESTLPHPTEAELSPFTLKVETNTPILEELRKLDAILPRYAEATAEPFYDDIKAQKQALRAKLI